MNTNIGFLNRLDPGAFRKLLSEAETQFMGRMPLYVFDNHDRPRSWDRYGDGKNDALTAKMIAAILLASRASALVHQGQEIGIVTTTPARKEDVRDPRGIAGWPKEKGRDGERTPMQWNSGRNAGFTAAPRPWLPIPAAYARTNVTAESSDPQSLLAWYSKLIGLRRSSPALRHGDVVLLDRDAQHTLVWVRKDTADANGTAAMVVACNMSGKPVVLDLQADVSKLVGRLKQTETRNAQRWLDNPGEAEPHHPPSVRDAQVVDSLAVILP